MSSDDDRIIYVDTIRPGAESRIAGVADYGVLTGTEIVGTADTSRAYVKLLQQTQQRQFKYEPRLEIVKLCRQIMNEQNRRPFKNGFILSEADLQNIIERYERTPQKEFKHVYLFIFGFILFSNRSVSTTMDIVGRMLQTWIREPDIIRYFRLHQRL
jgi:wobble nucleotide-excising tRNase